MFNFFKKQKDLSKYKSLDSLSHEKVKVDIPTLEIPSNDKLNILIMDDFEVAGEITKDEITRIGDMANKLKGSKIGELDARYARIIEKLDNFTLINLNNFNIDNYNIIMATGKLAAFSVLEALDRGLRVDYAVLDIIIGGKADYKGETKILDGIDVGKAILTKIPKAKILFYSGCSFEKSMTEYKRIMELTDKLDDLVLQKNNDLLYKKVKLINLLTEKK